MRCSLQPVWRANLLLCLMLFLHSGEARVHTEAQAGPLYRVVGSPLSIYCNVTGFASTTTRKDFEIRFLKPPKPEMNVISTRKSSFSYAVYSSRVKSGDITLTYVTVNSVLFEIKRLQKSDEGEFDCSVVNTESRFDGTYSAKTPVKVIDNSLSVAPPASTSLSYNEGDALTLTCQASSNTIQHTHLSLAWYLHREGEADPQPIISLDRDLTLSTGQGFQGRYQAGLIRLDKMGEATYQLNIAELEPSDQGRIYCQAQEWIQDPDRSWYSIAQRDAAETNLNVKARAVVPDASSLAVRILAEPTALQEGQELSLSCNVDTRNLRERFFSVAWLRGSDELARIGPTGILSVGPEYSVREKEGELRAARMGDRDYRLILQPVRTEDQGEYICKAWPQERSQDGVFTQGAAQESSSQLVTISATESGLSLEMQNAVSVNEGDRLTLTCKVHGFRGQLSVTWQHKATYASTAVLADAVSLSQEGVMETEGKFVSRRVKAARPTADTFTLELDEVTPSDAGVYQCAVSEWEASRKTSSQAQDATVTVAPVDSLVRVNLISRNSRVTVGENVELMCRVRGPRVPLTLTWSVQRDAATLDSILTLYSNGAISWSGEPGRYQLKVDSRTNEVVYSLLINGASHGEAGTYQCSGSVSLQDVPKKLPASNQLAVSVQNPVSTLRLTSAPALTSGTNTDIEIKCFVISEPSAHSRYAVTWLLQQPAENQTVISSDRDALVTFGPLVDMSRQQRISVKRTEGPSFELSIRQAQISDTGAYVCEVVEWLQDPRGDWYQLLPVFTTTEVTVAEPANDLRLDQSERFLSATEGDELQLLCNISCGASGAQFFYKVTWFYTGPGSSVRNTLLELDHAGLPSYPKTPQGLAGLQGRLRLSRPTDRSFYLGIQRAHEGDSGTYMCQVELFQLDPKGQWQQKASESGGPITLTVNVTENNLAIVQEEAELNVSTSQGFTIPCHVAKQSSSESELQVVWFRQRETETNQQPIFTVYRNSTLESFGRGDQLRFSHPFPDQFSLTVTRPGPEDSGLYFCEVEEWLLSLSRGWWKVAVEKSGYQAVNVYAGGVVKAVSGTECEAGTWIGILGAIIICTLLVIIILVVKMCRSKGGQKAEKSLWTEQSVSLNTKPSADE